MIVPPFVLVISIFVMLISVVSAQAHTDPNCEQHSSLDQNNMRDIDLVSKAIQEIENPTEISKESLLLSCDPKVIAEQIVTQKDSVVPSRLHHFGQRSHLNKNIMARTVPKGDWNQFIMSVKSRFGHHAVRQGLYATSGIDSNFFGHGIFGFQNDWMMEVVLDDSCRKSDAVATLNILSQDKRFQSWFASQKDDARIGFDDLDQYKKKCDDRISMTGFIDTNCDQLVERFLSENKIKVIQDHQLTKSFYIRDRSCIKSISGTPDEMLGLLANRNYLWMKPCQADYASEYIPYYLAVSLKEASEPIDKEILDKIDSNIDLLDNGDLKPHVRNLLNTYRQCASAGKLKEFRDLIDVDKIRNVVPIKFKWDATKSCH